jgi:hypothetical protein
MNDPVQKSLDERLAALQRNIAPPGYLWPGIASRLQPRLRRGRPMAYAAAAAAVAACLASVLTWAVLHGRDGAVAPQAAAASPAARAPSFDAPLDARYIAARASLEHTFRERLAVLEPATRTQIEASLAVIRKAHDDIQKALASDPSSPVLEQLWQSTWHDEFDLYDHVVRATQPVMTRT